MLPSLLTTNGCRASVTMLQKGGGKKEIDKKATKNDQKATKSLPKVTEIEVSCFMDFILLVDLHVWMIY